MREGVRAVRRVVITGIGLIGPTGVGLRAFWESLLEGHSGIGRISRFDPSPYQCQIGGEVRDRSYEELLDPRQLRTTTHATQLALGAAELGLRDARLSPTYYDPALIGVSIGTAIGGWRDLAQQHAILLERGARRVNPRRAPSKPATGSGRRRRLKRRGVAPRRGAGARFGSNVSRFHRST